MGNFGEKSRFGDRLKKINLFKRKKYDNELEIEDSNKMYNNFIKVVAAIPLMVYENVIGDNNANDVNQDKKNVGVKDENNSTLNNRKINMTNTNNHSVASKRSRGENRKIINSLDVSYNKNKQDIIKKNVLNNINKINKETKNIGTNNSKDTYDRTKELEKRIINLIKKDLIKMVNEYEILESELYLLSQINGDDKVLSECKKNVLEIKNILCKLDKLKNKYDYLKDNYDFEYMLEINEGELVDNIIELKSIVDNDEIASVVEDYKLLDTDKFLYLKIDDLHSRVEDYEKYKEQKAEELKKRDIDFEKVKARVFDIGKVNSSYESFVKEQNDVLKSLSEKVANIDSHEEVYYRMVGFGKLLGNTFKYLGLLMLSPLRGVVPSIATQTIITRNAMGNLYNNIHWEENRKMVYEAIDYSSEIRNAINDLDSTDRLVDKTLDDIIKLKMIYNDRFRQYQGDFYEYKEVIRKINDMENKIIGNKIKIELMKKKMLEKEQINAKKLVLVKQYNNQQGNNN